MPANEYAQAKGRGAAALIEAKPARPLSEAEQVAVAAKVKLVKQHLPEAMDLIRELHAEGMVDGLRCITSVTVFEEGRNDGQAG